MIALTSISVVSAHTSVYPLISYDTPVSYSNASGNVDINITVEDNLQTQYVNYTITGAESQNAGYKLTYTTDNIYSTSTATDGGHLNKYTYTWDTTNVVDGLYYIKTRSINNESYVGEGNIALFINNHADTTTSTAEVNPDASMAISFATYIGGTGSDTGRGIYVDSEGNIYTAMQTNSKNLITTTGAYQNTTTGGQDLYVAKFSKDGKLIYATYIGGSSTEQQKDLKVDKNGNVYLTGLTASKDFPVTENALQKEQLGKQSAYLIVLNADGTDLLYSTYLGADAVTRGWALGLKNNGNVVIQGITNAINFTVTDNAYQKTKDGVTWDGEHDDADYQNSFDIFLSEINPKTGELVYSTYFGGSGSDSTYGSLAVKDNVIYFGGTTTSLDFPVTENAFRKYKLDEADSFLTVLDTTNNKILFSSFIGGNGTEDGEVLYIDNQGFLYYVGDAYSEDFPTTTGAYQTTYGGIGESGGPYGHISGGDGYAMKIDTNNWNLLYATYLGGEADDGIRGLTVDDEGNAYIIGITQSSNFPVTPDAYQLTKNGEKYIAVNVSTDLDYFTHDTFITILNANGTDLLYSTYYGGEYGDFGMGIFLTKKGFAVQLRTYSPNLSTTETAIQKQHADDRYNGSMLDRTDLYDVDSYIAVFEYKNYTEDVTLTCENLNKFYNTDKNLTGQILDSEGNPIAGQRLELTLTRLSNGQSKTYDVVTDYNGEYKFPINLAKGEYTAKAVYAGLNEYQAAESPISNITVRERITPTILPSYATYIGGNGSDLGYEIKTDKNGNIYTVMSTTSAGLPTTPGAFQSNLTAPTGLYVAKFSPQGELLYATYISGTNGKINYKDFDLDEEGNAYIIGFTWSLDWPTTENAINRTMMGEDYWSGILTVLNANGTGLIYSTYLQGSKLDRPFDVVANNNGIAAVTGYTNSDDFVVTDNAYQKTKAGVIWDGKSQDADYQNSVDAFITKINTKTGELLYSTYFGGSATEAPNAIEMDENGVIYVGGYTSSLDLPVTQNALQKTHNPDVYDDFVIIIDGDKLLYSSFFGGNDEEEIYAMKLINNTLIFSGNSLSDNLPVTANAYQKTYAGGDGNGDGFIAKLNLNTYQYDLLTYIGGSGDEMMDKLNVDSQGNIWVFGTSDSKDYPITDDAYQTDLQDASGDAVLSKLNSEGSQLLYSTYYGGNGLEYGEGLEFTENGFILQLITRSSDLYTSDDAFQKEYTSNYENYFVIFDSTQKTTVMTINNFTEKANSGKSFTGTIKDANNNPVMGQHVKVTLTRLSNNLSKTYDVVSDYTGTFTLPINLAPGQYSADCVFDTANGYASSNTTASITVI